MFYRSDVTLLFHTMRYVSLVSILCFAFSSNAIGLPTFEAQATGEILGRVVDEEGRPLPDVNVFLESTTMGGATDKNGNYRISGVLPGSYSIQFSSIGFQVKVKSNIAVYAGGETRCDVHLRERVIPMREIVVTPGKFSIAQQQPVKQQAIEKETIAAIPATLDDIYRVMQILPGVGFSDDYSAHFHVRGGKQSENLILLDGMEIYDPYHLKNIGGAVGIMNMDVIENMSIMTGGFEARYGDRLSSVMSIENRRGRTDRFRGNVSAGGTGLSMLLETLIPLGSGILSFRKSFLKEAVEILNPTDYTFSPSYYDVQGKASLAVSPNDLLTFNLLYSKDNSYLERWRNDWELYSDYGNSYQGLVWQRILNRKLISELILSRGENFYDNQVGGIKQEKLNLIENVSNWNLDYQPHPKHQIACGVTYKDIRYHYRSKTDELPQDQSELEEVVGSYLGSQDISPKTYKLAFFVQDKVQLLKSFYMNIGLRYDYFEYNEDQQTSPRISVAYHLKNKTIFRAAWGHYYQAPVYTDLSQAAGATINPRAEKSVHYVVGMEHFISDDFNVRLEAYVKRLEHMIGHYIVLQDGLPALAYGNPNAGWCRGIEFFIHGRVSRALSIWAAYAYSQARIEAYFIDWYKIQINQMTVPRFTDQPHNFSLFINYKLPKAWEINLKWRYLSGVPYTPRIARSDDEEAWWGYGRPNSARYPAYHRLDWRVGKKFIFNTFQLTAFFEIKNLYNHKNILMYDYQIVNDEHVRKSYYTLPFLPTIEFKISF